MYSYDFILQLCTLTPAVLRRLINEERRFALESLRAQAAKDGPPRTVRLELGWTNDTIALYQTALDSVSRTNKAVCDSREQPSTDTCEAVVVRSPHTQCPAEDPPGIHDAIGDGSRFHFGEVDEINTAQAPKKAEYQNIF
jgi:hypothetical protein